MKESRNPQNIHKPLGQYSHQIEITGNERMLVLSGQVGMREDGSVPEDAFEQIDIAFENIFRNLQAANMDVKDIVKLTYYLVGEIDTAKRRELTASKLQGHQPCSTLLYVAALAAPIYKVEIDAWASRQS
ncbi:RidA family protein [Candidatus Villigracilis affinis]|uniref:RidA family protein n=1 Tax=Candidatus Villigracilis affinis TaxID=3140682 RepID=UPI002A22F576|nr:RidA family protein [Anaerolineales bacterium]